MPRAAPFWCTGAVRETKEGRNASSNENAEKNNNKLSAESRILANP